MASRYAKAPISTHRLFPVIVAIWFAALFGLGCGVLPNALFERFVTISGLSSLVPAAAPPLGVTARIVLSVSAALIGAVTGFSIARKVATAQAGERPNHFAQRYSAPAFDGGARRPISAKEELGSATLDAPATGHGLAGIVPPAIPGRRRALAMAEDNRPSDFLHSAPLPGSESQSGTGPSGPSPASSPANPPYAEPLELQVLAAPEPEPAIAEEAEIDPGLAALRNVPGTAASAAVPEPFEDEFEAAPLDEAPVETSEPELPPVPEAASSLFAKPLLADEELEDIAGEPRPFADPELSESAGQEPEPASEDPAFDAADADDSADETPLGRLPGDPGVPLEALGMVELAERLGQSLQRRLNRPSTPPPSFAEMLGEAPVDEPAPDLPPAELAADAPEPATAIEDAEPPFAPPQSADEEHLLHAQPLAPPPPVIPAALRPLPLELDEFGEDEDEEDHRASFALPLSGFSASLSEPSTSSGEEAEDDGEADSENYSSLLSMKSPFRSAPEFVRIEELEPEPDTAQPAVVFPGASAAPANGATAAPQPAENADTTSDARPFDAPANAAVQRRRPDPDETERALRSALATLQRMSGAA